MTIRLIKIDDNEERVETGATQFGENDLPGIFIRGDNAAYFAMCLDDVLNNSENTISELHVKGLAELLKSCTE